jgi:hypothetical protein
VNGKVSNIDDTKFEELKEHIRSKYGSLLPDGSYDSPESLYKALEAMQKHTGYSLVYNARAYKVLEAAVHSPLVFTTRDLSERSGLPLHSVSDCIYRWQKYHYKYLTRLPKRRTHGANRYKLRKWGVATYLDWKNRIQRHNFELNRGRYSPKKVDCYFVVNKYGKFMGLTNDDLPKSL